MAYRRNKSQVDRSRKAQRDAETGIETAVVVTTMIPVTTTLIAPSRGYWWVTEQVKRITNQRKKNKTVSVLSLGSFWGPSVSSIHQRPQSLTTARERSDPIRSGSTGSFHPSDRAREEASHGSVTRVLHFLLLFAFIERCTSRFSFVVFSLQE